MKKGVLITTIFTSKAVKVAIHKLSPEVVICVVEKDYEKVPEKRKAIDDLKSSFGDILKIEILETKSLYDLYEITKDVIKEIDKLSKESEIFIHVSEGRKTLAFGLSFAAYIRKDDIKGLYYVIAETNELIKLPLFSFQINKTQKIILRNLKDGTKNVDTLMNQTRKSRSVFYQYLKELQEGGYISNHNKELKLTDLGRIMVL